MIFAYRLRHCYLGDGVDGCSVIKQEADHVHLTKVTSCMQRCVPSLQHACYQYSV